LSSGIPELGIEEQHQKISGERGWSRTDKMVHYDIDGHIAGTIGFALDITEQKRSERELQESEERYRSLFDHSKDAILLTKPDGSILEANPAACEMFGRSLEVIRSVGRNGLVDMTDPRLQAALNERARRGAGIAEISMLRPNGDKFPAEITSAVFADASGQQKTSMIIRDITDRKRAEEALMERDLQFKKLSSHVPGMIYQFMKRLDGAYCVPFTTEAIKGIFGCSPQDVREDFSPITRVVLPEDLDRLIGSIESSAERMTTWQCEYRVQIPDRPIRWMFGHSTPERLADGCIIWHGFNTDITERKEIEEAVVESSNFLTKIVNAIPDPVFVKDRQHRWILLNDSFCSFMGYSRGELIGKSDYDFFPASEADVFWQKDEEVFASGIENENEEQFTDAKGATHTIITKKSRYVDVSGHQFLVGVIRDVTERKQAEETLRKSEARFHSYFDMPLHGIAITSPNKRWVQINDQTCSILGYTRDELVLMTWTEMTHPDDFAADLEQFNRILSGQIEQYRMDKRFFRKDGTVVWTRIAVGCVREADGKVHYIVCLMDDITERKRTENALRESEQKYRTLIENVGEAIFVTQNGMVRFANAQTEELIGYTKEELTSRPFIDFIHPKYQELVLDRHIKRHQGVELPSRYSFQVVHRSGEARWVELKVVLIEWDGKSATLNFLNDITERKRTGEERRRLEERLQRAEKMEALGILAGGVAHDLNNVLGIVVGYSELLSVGVDEPRTVSSYAKEIQKGGERAAAIVQDLLTLARRGIPSRNVLNVNSIVLECLRSPDVAKLCAYHPNIQIKTDLEADLLNISGSAVHLGKSFLNLISNAAEAMPDGGGITIKTANHYLDKPVSGYDEVREGDNVVLSVSDPGEGIPVANLKRIFEPFYTKKVMGRSGTGLGLAVVWGTVKDHHGYINVASEEGKGTTFTLYFPVTRKELTPEEVAVSASEYMGNGESILVVDDVKEQRELATMMLTKLNYRASSVSSGEEAVKYLQEHTFDLVVLDMIMDPGMDGLETYVKILEINPHQKAIIVSGFSETERVTKAQELGAGAYVKKPYVLEKLGVAVRKEIDRLAD
jgi:PAS domain S-box-containing protein